MKEYPTIRSAILAAAIWAWMPHASAQALKLHVPSPDWRDQVIYFVLTDRFADGDPSNNDQGAAEFKAGERGRYNGGDLQGLRNQLDYIKGLGATALWITPPVANQWYEPSIDYTGYHGYWAEHFKRVDAHTGTLEDYQRLSDGLHRRGMYLVQDIVVNHTGNFFEYKGGWDRNDPAKFYTPNVGTRAISKPTQSPFDQNDPRNPAQRAAGIYHWTPAVGDYGNQQEVWNHQMSSLDDLNTENLQVRRALRDSYGYWIREVGVDAYRVDTAFYVPPAYFTDFMFARDPKAPGIAHVARATGRKDFLVFGEGFAIDRAYEDKGARKIEGYMHTPSGQAVLPSMLNFPLYGSLSDVFARGQASDVLAHRISATLRRHPRAHWMPNFIDNHDVDRFLSYGNPAGLQQALLALFTLPGIPTIYYGTEQDFRDARASMFASGWGSGGRDRYDTTTKTYQTITALAQLRRTHKALSRGTFKLLHSNPARPGALVYSMQMAGAAEVIVAFNSADHPVRVDNLALRGQLKPAYGQAPQLHADARGRLNLELPARAAWVWTRAASARSSAQPSTPIIQLEALRARTQAADFQIAGTTRTTGPLQLVIDEDVTTAQTITPDATGRFQATVRTQEMSDPTVEHRAVVWAGSTQASAPIRFRLNRPWRTLVEVNDPAGDDRGPTGQYAYPTDPSYAARQMDLRHVRVSGNGGALRVDLQLAAISTLWSPANGFDHVALTVYIELPDEPGGATIMPLQQSTLPNGMRWHRRLRVHGWSNALFSAEGAEATNEGTPLSPGATIRVDPAHNAIALTLPAAALGKRASLSGAKIYVTTWDYDAGYRKLDTAAQSFSMGGPASGALVMDDSGIITLP
jgi:glycosidase